METEKTGTGIEGVLPILLVEDEHDYATLIQDAIHTVDFPHVVQAVDTGEEAIAYLSGEGKYADRKKYPFPILLLLDLKMPGMGGFGVLRWLSMHSDLKQNLRIVILSSVQSVRDIEVVYELGAEFFWPKSEYYRVGENVRRLRESCSPTLN